MPHAVISGLAHAATVAARVGGHSSHREHGVHVTPPGVSVDSLSRISPNPRFPYRLARIAEPSAGLGAVTK
jgi:hypothetical protein